jgi:hypothetical protein
LILRLPFSAAALLYVWSGPGYISLRRQFSQECGCHHLSAFSIVLAVSGELAAAFRDRLPKFGPQDLIARGLVFEGQRAALAG